MSVPSYYLSRPASDITPAIRSEFDELFAQSIHRGTGEFIDYSCDAPKWQFLCYLGDSKNVLFHGTGNPEIAEFEPRQSDDIDDFGNQEAVYAASDPLWATYFAVANRDRYSLSLVNSCVNVIHPDERREPFYFFSINEDALVHRPWRVGTIYVLPQAGFERQKSSRKDRESAQWRSFDPVKPLAKISVEPSDFPFLEQVRGHDFAVLRERAEKDPDGFPWLDE